MSGPPAEKLECCSLGGAVPATAGAPAAGPQGRTASSPTRLRTALTGSRDQSAHRYCVRDGPAPGPAPATRGVMSRRVHRDPIHAGCSGRFGGLWLHRCRKHRFRFCVFMTALCPHCKFCRAEAADSDFRFRNDRFRLCVLKTSFCEVLEI